MTRLPSKTRAALAAAAAVLALAPCAAARAASFDNAVAHRYFVAHDDASLKRYAEAWVASDPRSVDANEWLFMADEHLKRWSDALPVVRRLAQLEPQDPMTWQFLSATLSYLGDDRGSVQALYDGAEHAGAHFTSADWYNYANRLASMNQTRQAIPWYRRALALDRRNAAAWNNLGTVYYELGMLASAQQSYQQAANLGDGYARKNLALIQADLQAASRSTGGAAAPGSLQAGWQAAARQHQHDLLFYGHDMLPGDRYRG